MNYPDTQALNDINDIFAATVHDEDQHRKDDATYISYLRNVLEDIRQAVLATGRES